MKRLVFVVAAATVFISMIALSVMQGTIEYERASGNVCNPPTVSSANCVTELTTPVIGLDSRTTQTCYTYGGCVDDPVPLTGVVFEQNGQHHTLWFLGAPELKSGQMIEVSAWDGRYIGIVDRGHWRESYYWEPGGMVYILLVPVMVVLMLLLGLLIWRLHAARVTEGYLRLVYTILTLAVFLSLIALVDDETRQFILWL